MAASDKLEITQMINDCYKHLARCSAWESDFIKSIQKQNAEGKSLTRPQIACLDKVWEKVT